MIEGSAATVPPPQHFRVALAERLGVAAAAAALIAIAAAGLAGAAALYATNAVLALVLAGIGLTIGSLAGHVTREAVSRWRLNATIYAGRLTGFLPRRRGFVIGAREELSVALNDIERIETREEIFSSLGVTTGQRAYELALKDGGRIFLGADRDMLPPHFRAIVEAIVSRTHATIIDRGMVDGDAGFMLVAGVKVPDWTTPPLSPAEAARRTTARNRTPVLLLIAAAFVILARMIGD